MTPASPVWRIMRDDDLAAVDALAKRVHLEYPERPEVARERLKIGSPWCRVLALETEISGYLIAHPWRRGAPPALDTLIGDAIAEPDCLYLHDFVIAPERRGCGDAARVLKPLLAKALECFPGIALVSISGLESYWRRWGFCVVEVPGIDAILGSYDVNAVYMERDRSDA